MKIKFTNLYKLAPNKIKIFNKIKKNIRENKFIGGKTLNDFSKLFGDLVKTKYVVPVANGTDALEIALKALALPKGSEVIVPVNTWISTAEAVISNSLKVVFCDISLNDYTICVNDLKKKITKKTKCIIPVHLYGNPADMIEINRIAKKNKIKIIEDCAQAHGSKINNKHVGNFGDIGTFSFFPGKNIGAFGDAGCIITNKKNLYDYCKRTSNHGALIKYDHKFSGRNSRMDVLNATVIIEKIKKYNFVLRKRNLLASYYDKKFKNNKNIKIFKLKKNFVYSYHQYVIRVKSKYRNNLINFLKKNNIDTMIHYPYMLNELKFFQCKTRLKNANKIGKNILSLPISEEHTKKEIIHVASKINVFFNHV
tara:strand:- start:2414 stop:3514 length:1101 start_codon:yes stop_codon:yes gene_type:complete